MERVLVIITTVKRRFREGVEHHHMESVGYHHDCERVIWEGVDHCHNMERVGYHHDCERVIWEGVDHCHNMERVGYHHDCERVIWEGVDHCHNMERVLTTIMTVTG